MSLKKIKDNSQTASFPYLVLAVSLLLTVVIAYNFDQSAKNKDKIRFNNEINNLRSAIENKVNLYIALLKGGRGFIESNQYITRQNFAEYVESLDLDKNYTGVQGIGYARVVAAGERAALTEKMKDFISSRCLFQNPKDAMTRCLYFVSTSIVNGLVTVFHSKRSLAGIE